MVRNQAHQMLSYNVNNSKPETVSVAQICWPLGQRLSDKDLNCRQKRLAWILNTIVPPTLETSDQPLGERISQTIWIK